MARPRWLDDPRAPLALHALALGVAAALLLPSLGRVPGLNGDEAWAGLRAHEILGGARPGVGMNPWTGPFQQYAVAAFLAALGPTVAAIRLPSAIASLAALHLWFLAARRWFGDAWTAALGSMALASFPLFVLSGRLALEVTMLGPLLAVAACWLLLRGTELAAIVAGALLAIGCWNHLLFAPVALVLAGAMAVAIRRPIPPPPADRAALYRRGIFALTAFLVVLAPRLVLVHAGPGAADEGRFSVPGLVQRLEDWPWLALRILDGGVLFRRYTGVAPLPKPPLFAALVIAGVVFVAVRGAPRARALLAGGALLFLLTLVIAPANSDRYFLLPLLLAPAFAALAARPFLDGRAPVAALGIFLLVCALQAGRIGVDYFAAFSAGGGHDSELSLGRMPETSNHFVRVEPLREKLVAAGVRRVITEFHVGEPLRFLDLAHPSLDVVLVEELPPGDSGGVVVGSNDRFVVYSGGLRRLDRSDAPGLRVLSDDGTFTVMGR